MVSITHTSIVIAILASGILSSLANIHHSDKTEIKNNQASEPIFKDFISMVYDGNLHAELLTAFKNASEEQGLSSGTCLVDFTKLLIDLLRGQSYTYQVLDSIGKPPSALLQGGFLWLGSYDQCINITEYKSSTSKDVKFQGKHCLHNIRGPLLGKTLAGTGITIGICVPSSCTKADIASVTNLGLKAIFKLLNMTGPGNKTLYGTGGTCAEPAPWITGDIVAIIVCTVILILLVSGSAYDIVQRVLTSWRRSDTDKTLFPTSSPTLDHNISNGAKVDLINNEVNPHGTVQCEDAKVVLPKTVAIKGFFHQFFMSFSTITNAEKLLSASVREGQLGAVNGIRVISMWWVILGHTYYFVVLANGERLINPLSLLAVLKRFSFQAVVNATYSVDSFFFLSGLLVSYLLLKELKKSDGKVNWALLYFHRLWRLTPVYMFVLMIFATIAVHVPTGPFMRASDGAQTQCQKYWWTNLLYINNLHPEQLGGECMGWSWYLANDMQFFIITPAIVYLLYRFRYVGYSVVTVLIAMNLIVTGVIARVNHVHPGITGMNKVGGLIYVRPWHRISPYAVGIATGYILYVWENNGRPKIYKIGVVIGWSLAIAINMSVLYGLYGPNSTGILWNDDVNALYTATSRFAWSLGLAWLTFACVTGYGGPINVFLAWRVWAPLGRLTYCAYLLHPVIMLMYYTSLRQLINQNDYTMIYLYIAHLVVAYMVAFVVSIAVEAPMLGLEKLIFKKKKD